MSQSPASHADTRVGDLRIWVVAARYNEPVVARLVDGAMQALRACGASDSQLELLRVPGAFDLPPVVRRVAASGRCDAVVALGVVIRGETAHFDYVAAECAAGLARASQDTGVPVTFGVLTTDTEEQALARAGGAAGDKGAEAALAAVELANLLRRHGI